MWFEKAAKQGHAKGQYNLGATFYRCQGVLTNFMLATKWLEQAAELMSTLRPVVPEYSPLSMGRELRQ